MTPADLLAQFGPRESMEYDVVIVGAGPAGLAAAIRIKQLDAQLSVVVLEKGAEVGAHTLSGAVMDTRALSELFPDWQERGAPITQPVTSEEVLFLSEKSALPTPKLLLPDCLRNHGGYVISLGAVCKWLAQQAEALGVDVYPGFVADEVLFDAQNRVRGDRKSVV